MSIIFFEGAAAQLQYRNTVVVDIGLGLGGDGWDGEFQAGNVRATRGTDIWGLRERG
jgi:hypothetical protein